MAIVAALIGVAGAVDKPRILFLGIPIVAIFAALDASYLTLERGFRSQYNELRTRPLNSEPDFHIDPKEVGLSLGALFSWSVAGFYGAAVAILLFVGVIM
jgi:hypothetical protein